MAVVVLTTVDAAFGKPHALELLLEGFLLFVGERSAGIAALLAFHLASTVANGVGQHVVKALLATPGVRKVLEIRVRRPAREEQNFHERLVW